MTEFSRPKVIFSLSLSRVFLSRSIDVEQAAAGGVWSDKDGGNSKRQSMGKKSFISKNYVLKFARPDEDACTMQ